MVLRAMGPTTLVSTGTSRQPTTCAGKEQDARLGASSGAHPEVAPLPLLPRRRRRLLRGRLREGAVPGAGARLLPPGRRSRQARGGSAGPVAGHPSAP